MPAQLKISGWSSFSRYLPGDARLLRKYLADMKAEYPERASDVVFG
jgi:hypothetical protein